MPCNVFNFLCANPCCCPPAAPDQWHSGICCCCATLDGPGFCIDPCCTLCMFCNPSWLFMYNPEGQEVSWPCWAAALACPCSCCVQLCMHGNIPLNRKYHRKMIGVEVESSYFSYFCCFPCWPSLFSAQRFREIRVRGMLIQKKHKPSMSCLFYTCVGGWDACDTEKRQQGCHLFQSIAPPECRLVLCSCTGRHEIAS